MIAASLGIAMGFSPISKISPESLEKGWKYAQEFESQAMLVMQDGKVIFERYANGGAPDRFQALASGSKSFCGVVAAAAVHDKLLGYDEKVSDTLTDWKSDERKSMVTVRNLLSLNSGLTEGKSGRGAPDRKGWEEAKDEPMTSQPGQEFRYGPNSFNVFGLLIQTKLKQPWETYLKNRILDPLKIELKYVGRCQDGNPQLAGGAWMKAKDWLTFGEFIRNNGSIGGRQVVDTKVLDELYKPSAANPAYGMSWWLGIGSEVQMMRGTKPGPTPPGFKMAAGAGKQRLYIVPSQKLVVVRMGRVATGARGWSDRAFLESVIGKTTSSP